MKLAIAAAAALLASAMFAGHSRLDSDGTPWQATDPAGHSVAVAYLAESTQVRSVESSLRIVPGATDAALLLVPNHTPRAGEAEALMDQVRRGALLVVAADQPWANAWIAQFGLTLHGIPLLAQGRECVQAEANATGRATAICLPSPTTIAQGSAGLARLTEPAALDLDGDGRVTLQDQQDQDYAVASRTNVEAGTVILVADSQAWTNDAVLRAPGNLQFLRDLTEGRTVVYLVATDTELAFVPAVHREALRQATAGTAIAWTGVLFVAAILLGALVAVRHARWAPHAPNPSIPLETIEHARRLLHENLEMTRP